MGKDTPAPATAGVATAGSSAMQQNPLVVAVVTAVLASAGTSGGLTIMSGSTPADVSADVQELRGDVKSLKEKIDDIYEIVDRAHPRTP